MNFDLEGCTHYLIISGSHSYGGNTEDSDYDLRGWCIPPLRIFTAFDQNFDQSDQWYPFSEYPFRGHLSRYISRNNFRVPEKTEKIDHCIYNVHKFFKLAAGCNPNLIENLFVDDEEILICSKLGKRVRKNRHLFLSAKAKFTFTGYAVSQLKRINTHRRWLLYPPEKKPERKDFGLPEQTVIPADQRQAAEKLIEGKVREWLLQDSELLGTTELNILHSKLAEFVASILKEKDHIVHELDESELFEAARLSAMHGMGMSPSYIAALQAEKKYRQKLNEYKQYQTWKKNRNPERAKLEAQFGYDCKHGMQLVRLLMMGKELLTTGNVTVKRKDRQLFRDIKNGAWSYEKIIQYLKKVEGELNDIYENKKYVVPNNPPVKKLREICHSIIVEYIT